ncbi:hypothetical protein [Aureibacter tunicatorum]|uniref:Uncharacterized protein n=1 Tax=Aureibacter tunicatorum TaxID=866807 RepID=A0AAE3XT96_9BACT|nr:hypothetical protein [Aureibacter tunicatorum]MDR6241456.1 hypothetical protein [Aureibacter tunicatorum]BDD06699.1 hypothetical protein AUTU_41820 [Aureibacter tunicatorum]
MGYMGFGMNKENYERQPKEFYTNQREINKKDTAFTKNNPDAPKIKKEEILNKPYFKTLGDTLFLKIFKFLVLVFLLGSIFKLSFFDPWLNDYEKKKYKETLINAYSTDHNFLLNSNEKLLLNYFQIDMSMNTTLILSKGYPISVSAEYLRHPDLIKIGTWNSKVTNFELINSQLRVIQKDTVRILEKNWILFYQNDTIDSQYISALKNLNIDVNYINELRGILKANGYSELKFEKGQTIITVSNKVMGDYQYIRSEKPLKNGVSVIKLDSVTYLRKISSISLSNL